MYFLLCLGLFLIHDFKKENQFLDLLLFYTNQWSYNDCFSLLFWPQYVFLFERDVNCQMLPYLTAGSAVDRQGRSCVRWANDFLLELPLFPQHAHGKPDDGTAGLLWWDSPGEETEGPEGTPWAETGRVVRSVWRLLVWLPRQPTLWHRGSPNYHAVQRRWCAKSSTLFIWIVF